MNFKKVLLLGLSTSFLFSSCASILNGKKQTLFVNTGNAEATVHVDDREVGKGKLAEIKVDRDLSIKNLTVKRDGYLDENIPIYQQRKSPWYIMSVVPFGILFYPIFSDNAPNAYNYDKLIELESKAKPLPVRSDEEKFLYSNKTSFDVKRDEASFVEISRRKFDKNKLKFKAIDYSLKKDLDFEDTKFSSELNEILKATNYTDTTGTLLRKKNKTMYLDAKVVGLQSILVNDPKNFAPGMIMKTNLTKLEVEWSVLDYYKVPKFETTIVASSNEFAFDYVDGDHFQKSVEDAIKRSFLEFVLMPEVKELLEVSDYDNEVEYDNLVLTKSEQPTTLAEGLSATFTIKSEKGHGSGFAVSDDGYILTNYHVVANSPEDLTVIDSNQDEFEAELIRFSIEKDLALIKVDKKIDFSYAIQDIATYELGQEIYAIGTPRSIELGQSLTKGIISGTRENDGDFFLQIDASVNPGNSGGPLVNSNGQLIGVINAKVKGADIEGIGFAILADEIKKALYLSE